MKRRAVRAMMWPLLFAAAGGFLIASAGADPLSVFTRPAVVDLRCEYLQDPLGIDAREPRLKLALGGH